MITVSTSHAPAANYFTREGGYFECDAGVWFGGLARVLGLEGEPVRKRDFELLRLGIAPDGTPLLQNAGFRSPDGRGVPHPLAQITPNSPKDVAVLATLLPARRAEILRAHRDAVFALARYVESSRAFVRLGKGGKSFARAQICAAIFEHVSARDGSPHIHSHLVLMPAALASDRKTRRIAERVLFRAQKELSALYDAELSKNLAALGFRTIPLAVGFRIEGVSDEARRFLSTRREEILSELSARGLSGAREAERVTKLTRRSHPKQERSPDEVFDSAAKRLALAGLTPERCFAPSVPVRGRTVAPRPLDAAIIERAGAALPSDRTFTDTQAIASIAKEASRSQLGIAGAVEIAMRWLTSAAVTLVSARAERRVFVPSSVYQNIESSLSRLQASVISPVSLRVLGRLSADASIPAPARLTLPTLLSAGPRVRVLEAEPGPERDALLASIASLPISTLGLGLTVKQRDHMKELGFDRSFTLAKAVHEWGLTDWSWKPFRNAPHRYPIERTRSDWLTDELAAGFGFITRAEQRYRGWQRSRAGLDLSASESRVVVVDDAAWVDPVQFARLLREVERGPRNLLLIVRDPRERSFTPSIDHLEMVRLAAARPREEELHRELATGPAISP